MNGIVSYGVADSTESPAGTYARQSPLVKNVGTVRPGLRPVTGVGATVTHAATIAASAGARGRQRQTGVLCASAREQTA